MDHSQKPFVFKIPAPGKDAQDVDTSVEMKKILTEIKTTGAFTVEALLRKLEKKQSNDFQQH